jgi:hypothetical protein
MYSSSRKEFPPGTAGTNRFMRHQTHKAFKRPDDEIHEPDSSYYFQGTAGLSVLYLYFTSVIFPKFSYLEK